MMNSYEKDSPDMPLVEQYKNLLTGLSGVLSAKVSLDSLDNIREIHVLASADRNVKQVVRDVRSALSSFFDVDVDHRVISIAQMKEDFAAAASDGYEPPSEEHRPAPRAEEPHIAEPRLDAPLRPMEPLRAASIPEPPRAPIQPFPEPVRPLSSPVAPRRPATQAAQVVPLLRLKCGRISQSVEDDNYAVTITLKHGDQAFDGSCSARNNEPQRMAAIASATIAAVHNFLGQDNLFRLVSARRITSMPVAICMVLVECYDGHSAQMLVGATEIGQDDAVSVLRAVLDAINRKLLGLAPSLAE